MHKWSTSTAILSVNAFYIYPPGITHRFITFYVCFSPLDICVSEYTALGELMLKISTGYLYIPRYS